MNHAEIVAWLKEEDPQKLDRLWREADRVRRENVGDEVHLRGLVELSNYCTQHCAYCGIRVDNRQVIRYRLSEDEILQSVKQAVQFGYGTVVFQAGEDPAITGPWLQRVIQRIKKESDLAITLSLGERSLDDLTLWRRAGADRYLLRFETSNPTIFEAIHPGRKGEAGQRIALLHELRALGYEVGSGVMIGLPNQTYEDLARDVELFKELKLDMIGVGPYLPHPSTPLGLASAKAESSPDVVKALQAESGPDSVETSSQVPADFLTTCKVVALTRLLCPKSNIPATTALAAIEGEAGRAGALDRGANVIMPNVTPEQYRVLYEIYPEKACLVETAEEVDRSIRALVQRLGRTIGQGRGDSPAYLES